MCVCVCEPKLSFITIRNQAIFLKDNTKADLLDKKVQVRENITKTLQYKYPYVQ